MASGDPLANLPGMIPSGLWTGRGKWPMPFSPPPKPPMPPTPSALGLAEMSDPEYLLRQMMLANRARDEVPDLGPAENRFGEIQGWKLFSVVEAIDGTPLLVSPYQKTVWLPKTIATADTPPSETPRTGVYCWNSVMALRREEEGDTLAKVLLWGDVVEHEHGYRAQYCRIARVYATESDVDVELLQEMYDQPELQRDDPT